MKIWKKFFAIAAGFLAVLVICGAGTEENPEELSDLYARSAVLMDADSGRVLFGKEETAVLPMASTTKIMTCILVLENSQTDEIASVSQNAASQPKVRLGVQEGEHYRIEHLLYSLMLESHNDSAVALAEHVGRGFLEPELAEKPVEEYTEEESKRAVAAFARLMNEKAVELGCKNSWFITPNGLDATQEFTLKDGTVIRKEHCTTAAELARIMAYCIGESPQKETFLEITRTANYSFSSDGRSFSCVNHNAFLNMMDGALSGKTGFTNKAGYCYVGSLRRDEKTFVVALLACGWPNNKSYKWSDTKELMQYGIDNYSYRSFLEEGIAFDKKILKPIAVENGQTHILGETAYTDIEISDRRRRENGSMDFVADGANEKNLEGLLLREDEEIKVEYHLQESLTAPVKAGAEVGEITYSVGDTVYRRESIVTVSDVREIDFAWCIRQILTRFWL